MSCLHFWFWQLPFPKPATFAAQENEVSARALCLHNEGRSGSLFPPKMGANAGVTSLASQNG